MGVLHNEVFIVQHPLFYACFSLYKFIMIKYNLMYEFRLCSTRMLKNQYF